MWLVSRLTEHAPRAASISPSQQSPPHPTPHVMPVPLNMCHDHKSLLPPYFISHLCCPVSFLPRLILTHAHDAEDIKPRKQQAETKSGDRWQKKKKKKMQTTGLKLKE